MSLTDEDIAAAIAALGSPELRVRDDAAARLETGGWRAAEQLLDALVELEILPDPELLTLPVTLERTCPSTLTC